MKKILAFLLLLLILFPLARIVGQNWDYYWSPFKPEEAKNAYEISQYVREENVSWIPDELHFLYASWYYLEGGNPILVNPDYPPLGKYFVAFSIKFLNNEKMPTLFFAFLSLFSFFLLAKTFLRENWLALLPVVLLAWERLFQEQLKYLPLFEIFAFALLNLALYFFIKAEKENLYFAVASLFLGILWAIKPWMLTIPLIASWAVYLILERRFKKLIFWLVSLPIAVAVLLFSYLKLLLEGWSFYKVLSVQKWILWYHRSKLIKLGSVWPFLYLKRWYVWWGEKPYLAVDQWNIFWPIFTTLALIFSILVLLKMLGFEKGWIKRFNFNRRISLVALWVIFDLMFLSVGNINVRYVFYLLPFCYLLGIYFLTIPWHN